MGKFQSSAGDMCNLREPLGDTMRELFYLLEWRQLFSRETFLRGNSAGVGNFPQGQLYGGQSSWGQLSGGQVLAEEIVLEPFTITSI